MNDEKFRGYPFAETDSHFGELELFDDSTRKWAVSAKNKVIAFVIPKNEFLKLFTESDIRMGLFKSIVERHTNFEAYERECGRSLRRQLRLKEKIKKEVN
jgi:CRP-like cAMP-binding protein